MHGSLIEECRTIPETEALQHTKRMRSTGYTQIKGVFAPDFVAKPLEIVRELFELHKGTVAEAPGEWYANRALYLQNKYRSFINWFDSQTIETLLKPLLNDLYFTGLPPKRSNYILVQFVARSSVKRLQLHIDPGVPQTGKGSITVQLLFALGDTKDKTGCTLVVTKSHLFGDYSDHDPKPLFPVPARAGDIVFSDGQLWHGSGAHESPGSRWCVEATFQRWWIKQSLDLLREVPQKISERFEACQKAMIGYCSIPPVSETEHWTHSIPFSVPSF